MAIVRRPVPPGEEDIDLMVREAVRLSGGLDTLVSAGDSVIIKPNLLAPATPEQWRTQHTQGPRS